jgi:hypothetical protein
MMTQAVFAVGVDGVDFASMTTLALSLLDKAQINVAGR